MEMHAQAAEPATLVPMSRGRWWLAVYVDYLFFSAAWAPLEWLLQPYLAAGHVVVRLAAFAVFRAVIVRALGTTPAQMALGIARTGGGLGVAGTLVARERWWTMLAGVLLVLEGSKNLVRWTEGLTPPPFFGLELSPGPSFAIMSILGVLNVAAGLLVLRTRALGALLGIATSAVESASFVIGGDRLRQWIAQRTIERRALQGLPVRDGEVEMMQALLPAAILAAGAIAIVWLLCVHRRTSENAGAPSNSI